MRKFFRHVVTSLERFLRLNREYLDREGTKLLLREKMQEAGETGRAILLAAYIHIELPEIETSRGTVRLWETLWLRETQCICPRGASFSRTSATNPRCPLHGNATTGRAL